MLVDQPRVIADLARIVIVRFVEPDERSAFVIGLELSVRSDAAHRRELLQTLQNLREEAVREGVAIECRVFEDLSGTNHFLWLQWWRTQQQLESHLCSLGFRTLLGAIKVLGVLESARTVELQDSTSIMGALLAGRMDIEDRPAQH